MFKSSTKAATLCVMLLVCVACSHSRCGTPSGRAATILTNEDLIESLNSSTRITEPLVVFRYVFSALDSRVDVYPSEGYYYFIAVVDGILLHGAIGLFIDKRDKGLLGFAYEPMANGTWPSRVLREGIQTNLSYRDGVGVSRHSADEYVVSFEAKSVTFVLHDASGNTAPLPGLNSKEISFGTTFDESGLQFELIYDDRCEGFLWILRDDVPVPEHFDAYGPDIIVGRRTAFAFYVDVLNRRKVLLGVELESVRRNNWFDGPFDQLADETLRRHGRAFRAAVESRYPALKGGVDDIGVFLDDSEVRVAIVPYLEYTNLTELAQVVDSVGVAVGKGFDVTCSLVEVLRNAAGNQRGAQNCR